jgi:hypothetical protein
MKSENTNLNKNKSNSTVRLVIPNDRRNGNILKSELVSHHYGGGASCERIYAGSTQNSSDPDSIKCKKLLEHLPEGETKCMRTVHSLTCDDL